MAYSQLLKNYHCPQNSVDISQSGSPSRSPESLRSRDLLGTQSHREAPTSQSRGPPEVVKTSSWSFVSTGKQGSWGTECS